MGKRDNSFKLEIGTVIKNNKRDLIIIDREYRKDKYGYNRKYYKCHCNISNKDNFVREDAIINMINYNTTSRKKDSGINIVYPKLKDGFSYPEKFMFSILNQIKLNFKTQFYYDEKINWCENYKYDFYFEHENNGYIIEVHGLQHYEDGFSRCGGRTHEEEVKNDVAKKKLALINGIKEENYIVIDCRKSDLEWIKNSVLNSELCNLFDLNSVNWIECHKFSLSNRIVEACNLWNSGLKSTIEISNLMKISRITVIAYLKKGTTAKLCCYNPKIEQSNGFKYRQNNFYSIEVYLNNICVGNYNSATEIQKISEKTLGVFIPHQRVSDVLNGKLDNYKNYNFIKKLENA